MTSRAPTSHNGIPLVREAGGTVARADDPDTHSSIQILVVDDDRTLREGCANFLQASGYTVSSTGSGDEALELVKRRPYDIILLDLYMSQVPGMQILRAGLEANRHSIIVMMTGNPSVESNVEALRAGAWDYLLKPFTATHLEVLIGRATHEITTLRSTRQRGAALLRESGNSDRITCLGISPAFQKAVELARKVAGTTASVMISGESCTGKEVIAQFIHRHSRRANRKLLPINCAALPENLLESEMFGHRRGAFTGADREKPGLVETANGGTLFLDELTEMSLRLQAKLLRVLQDGVVRRVGSEQENAAVDVRFISATNRDPQEAVRSGVLREDLFYRLRVILIKLPALRQRPEDIPLLATHFLTHYWERHRQRREPAPRFAPGTLEFLASKPWHGNVRELQNVIEHLAVLAEPNQDIRPDDIPFYDDAMNAPVHAVSAAAMTDEAYYTVRERLITDFERTYLTRLVDRAAGNMSKAARMASIDRTTLYRLLERHRLRREDSSDTAASG